jgi:hypothetical protein
VALREARPGSTVGETIIARPIARASEAVARICCRSDLRRG